MKAFHSTLAGDYKDPTSDRSPQTIPTAPHYSTHYAIIDDGDYDDVVHRGGTRSPSMSLSSRQRDTQTCRQTDTDRHADSYRQTSRGA